MPDSVRILCVDDDADFTARVAASLEREYGRFEVETATSAEAGLERLEEATFECVVSDYDIPGTDGISFLRSVRERSPDLPFVLFTGEGSEEIASDAISAGATEYLRKESGTDQYTELANRIESVVESYRTKNEPKRSEAQYRSLTEDVFGSSEVGTVIIDADRTVAWLNDTAERYLGVDGSIVGADAARFAQTVAETVDHPDALADRLIETYGTNPSVERFECHISADNDRDELWLEHRSTPIETGVYAGGRVEHYTDITEYKQQTESLERVESYRKRLQETVSDTEASMGERIEDLLTLGCELLGTDNAHVVEIDHHRSRHEVRFSVGTDLVTAGMVTDLSETFCQHTIDGDGTLDLHDATDYSTSEAFGIDRYVGAKIFVDSELFGTLCFVDSDAESEPLSAAEKTFVDLMSQWISHALERDAARRQRDEMLDRMTDGMFALDEEWCFTYFNESGLEILQNAIDADLAVEEIRGRNIWDAIPDLVGTVFEDEYRNAMTQQKPVSFESYYEPLETWFNVRAYPSETGLSVYFLDVTEQHRREDAIRNRETILREVYDVVSDTDRSFNEQVEALLDIGRRVIGTEYGSLSRIRDDEYVFEVVQAPEGTIEAGDVVDLAATNCERAVVTKESLVLADVAADAPELTDKAGYADWGIKCYIGTPVQVDGRVYGTFCFYGETPREKPFSEWQVTLVDLMGRWISYGLERQRTEEQLRRQNNRLEEFGSVLSHDLRNPLNVARGNLDLLDTELGDEGDEYIEAIANAHNRIETLISDVLTMAREGTAVEETDRVSLEALATGSWIHVETDAAELTVVSDLAFRADPDRLGRVFENLFRNAVEHGLTSPDSQARQDSVEHSSTGSQTESDDSVEHGSTEAENGTVTIRVGRLRDGFYIEDDGPGIPESERDRVFEYGYSTHDDGTGFGLGIVRGIVQAHGWEITLTESETGGARFEITGVDTAE